VNFLLAALVALLAVCPVAGADGSVRAAPSYSTASIVNAASNISGALAPNTIATVYGTELAYVTKALSGDEVTTRLPTAIGGTGVRVLVGGILAGLYYVSPGQVNFLVPAVLVAGPSEVVILLDGRPGPTVRTTIQAAAPALFLQEVGWAVATRPDGSIVSKESPARPGDVIVLYGTGFGQTARPLSDGLIPRAAAEIERASEAKVMIAGKALERAAAFYIGVTPGFAGLYQINLRVPPDVGENPEIAIEIAGQSSPPGVRLPAGPRPNSTQPQVLLTR
jgi:uncharacterized protein (TIGR03437 family)